MAVDDNDTEAGLLNRSLAHREFPEAAADKGQETLAKAETKGSA